MKHNLNNMPSYSGLHYIMSQQFTPRFRVEEQYAQIEEDFDINDSILADEAMELEEENDYLSDRQLQEYEETFRIITRQNLEE